MPDKIYSDLRKQGLIFLLQNGVPKDSNLILYAKLKSIKNKQLETEYGLVHPWNFLKLYYLKSRKNVIIF